ncbi:MAG: trypsin-like peptidase domain-containing protein [Myxococcales bacterium]|nr:trypsin-like peptidase domain-containing protein [Myxococcales bacterium]
MLLLGAALVMMSGCGAVHALPPVMQDLEPAKPVDDASLRRQLLAGAQLAHETGKTVPMATLRSQLGRRHGRFALPHASPQLVTGPQLGRRLREAVVIVGNLHKCGKCSRWHVGAASGFFISKSGLLVTSYHVVDKSVSATLVVMLANGAMYPVLEVVAADPAHDLAVLRVQGGSFTALPLANPPHAGRKIVVMSHPNERFYTLTAGVVSRIFVAQRLGRTVQMMQLDAAFAKGSSGGPIVDGRGAVVGVVRATHVLAHGTGDKRVQQMVVGSAATAAAIRLLISEP